MRVAGWVHRRRDHGGLIFIDLRDRSGLVQLVFHPETAPEAHALAERLRTEYVLSAAGEVVRARGGQRQPEPRDRRDRGRGRARPSVLAESETPPFPIDEDGAGRRDAAPALPLSTCAARACSDAMLLRHTVVRAIRDYLDAHGFLEIETPILTSSTPEGARDYLVPVALQPGAFYALPQSPQLFKQLLMIAGFERYFQIARCFRDEDLRADRQPEFTQLDLEMSLRRGGGRHRRDRGRDARACSRRPASTSPPPPFPRHDATPRRCARFGSDKPDLRFGLEIADLGDAVAGTEFKVFAGVLDGRRRRARAATPGGARRRARSSTS